MSRSTSRFAGDLPYGYLPALLFLLVGLAILIEVVFLGYTRPSSLAPNGKSGYAYSMAGAVFLLVYYLPVIVLYIAAYFLIFSDPAVRVASTVVAVAAVIAAFAAPAYYYGFNVLNVGFIAAALFAAAGTVLVLLSFGKPR